MGLFSSKKKYIAHAASSSLIEDGQSTLRSELLKNVIEGGPRGPSDAVKIAIHTDMYARARSMLKYAAKPDGYIRGFPESNMTILNIDEVQLEAALTRAVGDYDSITSTVVGKGQEIFFANSFLKDQYDNTDYFPWPDGVPAGGWDENMDTVAIPVVNPDTGEYYQASNDYDLQPITQAGVNRDEIDTDDWYTGSYDSIFSGRYRIVFTYEDNNGDTQTWTVAGAADLSGYTTATANIIQIKYVVGGETFYWHYVVGSNEDPELEAYIDIEERNGKYLPVAVLMQDKVWFDEVEGSQLEVTTNKLVKKLGTSGTNIREDFQAQEEEDNESGDASKANAEKWDFFVHFAIPIRTKERGALEYLFHYFKQLETWGQYSHLDYDNYITGAIQTQPINEIRITEAGLNGYNVAYRWSYCYSVTKPGYWQVEDEDSNGSPIMRDMRKGEYTSHLQQRTATNDTEYREMLDEIFGSVPGLGTFVEDAEEENHDYFVVTRQEKTGDEYTHVIIMAPSMEYTVNTAIIGVDGAKDYRFRYAQPTIWDEDADPEAEGVSFRFPIHVASLLEVSRMHREEALQAGLSGTVFLVEIQKKKWYETGFFKWLIIIIAIVLVVLSIFYPGFLKAAAEAIALAAGIGGSAVAVWVIFAVLQFAVGFVISLAGQLIGGVWGQIFMVVATIAVAYGNMAGQPGGFSWTGAETAGFAQAAAFVTNVNALVAQPFFAIHSAYTAYKVQEEWDDFLKDHREKMAELKEWADGIGDLPDGINPFDLVQVYSNPGASEMPDGYIARTVDNNPGQKAIQLVTDFPEVCLQPPQAGQTGIIEGVFVDLAKQRGAA
jgi:hypothetical protein